jgi:hypothetical protein
MAKMDLTRAKQILANNGFQVAYYILMENPPGLQAAYNMLKDNDKAKKNYLVRGVINWLESELEKS